MGKIFSVLTLIVLVFSLAGASAAEEKAKPNIKAGAVKAIDAKTKTMTIRADKQPDFTFTYTDKTALRTNNNQKVTFNDIKVGTIMVLIYDVVDGKNIARGITIAGMVPQSTEKKSQAQAR